MVGQCLLSGLMLVGGGGRVATEGNGLVGVELDNIWVKGSEETSVPRGTLLFLYLRLVPHICRFHSLP